MNVPHPKMSGLRKLLLGIVTLAIFSSISPCPSNAYVPKCQTGPEVEERFCHYITHYQSPQASADPLVVQALGAPSPSDVRSIALIIAVSKYPKLGADLKAASVDGSNLEAFFRDDQKFDEIIVLRDEEATKDRIDDFLRNYLPSRSRRYPNFARLVIAYSGHGSEETSGRAGTAPAAFLLSAAESASDPANTYLMTDFATRVRGLSKSFHQVLTLVNACYGGSLYVDIVVRPGGNANDFSKRGSYALAAGSPRNPVVSIDEKRGSVFFDAIVSGIRSGDADRGFNAYVGADGAIIQYGGLTRALPLVTYVGDQIQAVNNRRLRTNEGILVLDPPWFGPLASPDQIIEGGPFFLSPKKVSGPDEIASTAGPASFAPGRPDIKLFRAPEIYPIRGIDLSVRNGKIDWPSFLAVEKPNFVYVRSNSWSKVDPAFRTNWNKLKVSAVDYGAQVVFSFCSGDRQFDEVVRTVPVDGNALPIAVILVTPVDDKGRVSAGNVRQAGCYPGVAQAKRDISLFLQRLESHYKKRPIIYGNAYNLNVLTDSDFNRYMIWLAAYGISKPDARVPVRNDTPKSWSVLQFKGDNPWTLWQYTGQRNAVGIGETTSEVFFGTPTDYKAFKTGEGNVARDAALRTASANAKPSIADRSGLSYCRREHRGAWQLAPLRLC